MDAFLAHLLLLDHQPMGSFLKFCRMAEGHAHLYVRPSATHEWGPAAGDAILSGARGRVADPSGVLLLYGERDTEQVKRVNVSVPLTVSSVDGDHARAMSLSSVMGRSRTRTPVA